MTWGGMCLQEAGQSKEELKISSSEWSLDRKSIPTNDPVVI